MGSKDYFDAKADQWDDMQSQFFSDRVRDMAICRSGVKAGFTAADIGAGSGFITAGLLKKGLNVIAVDQSEKMLDEIKKKFPNGNSLETRVGDANRLPLDNDSVDAAFANMYLHHVEIPKLAIEEMVRIIHPGGNLIITDLDTHEHKFLQTEQHDVWMGFERDHIEKLFIESGLVDVSVTGIDESCNTCSTADSQAASISIFLASGRKP